MEIVKVPIDTLVTDPKNARKHSTKNLKSIETSITTFGTVEPLVVRKANNQIIGGNGRFEVLKKLKHTHAEVVYVDVGEREAEALGLALNKSAELAEWNADTLFEKLKILKDDFALEDFGFDLTSLEMAEVNPNDPDECPDVEFVVPRCALGDVWQLGKHTLLVGDSTDEAAVFLLMHDTKADLIVTDPPYNVNYEEKNEYLKKYRPSSRKKSDIQNDKLSNDDFYTFLEKVYTNYNTISKEGAGIYVFFPSSETLNFIGAMVNTGWLFKQTLVWKKNHIVLGRQDYQWIHEPILYGWKEGAAHNWYADRKQTTVLEFNKPGRSPEHPTMKPIDILEYLICNSSKKDDVVVDLFGGSGSTLIACEKNNRICRTMELDPKYASVIVDRWEKYTNKVAIKLDSDKQGRSENGTI